MNSRCREAWPILYRGVRWLLAVVATLAMVGVHAAPPVESASVSCRGKFLNPISDICWSCVFPMRVGSASIYTGGQEDANNSDGSPFCYCGQPPRIGVKIDFWEPARLFEAVRKPHCYVSLGGIELDPGFDAPESSGRRRGDGDGQFQFYQAHWYTNPIFYWLEVLTDNSCLEQGVFDLAYATEYDPLWDDDLLSFFLSPDSALFANVIANAACTADCVAATVGFGTNLLFWCAGCQGGLYPLTGNVTTPGGGIRASELLLQRMTTKLHRQGLMWAGSGRSGLCRFYPQMLMDKTNYKAQLTYPVPATRKFMGRCCRPYGRTTIEWGAGKEFPYEGEDFAYQVFRKRSCCAGSSLWNMAAPN